MSSMANPIKHKEYLENQIRFMANANILSSVCNVDGKTIVTFKSGNSITYPMRLEP